MDNRRNGDNKIKIGRLAVDPIFLLLFLFSVLSTLGLGLVIFLSAR